MSTERIDASLNPDTLAEVVARLLMTDLRGREAAHEVRLHVLAWQRERSDAAALRERIRLLEQGIIEIRDTIGDRTHGATYSECCRWWCICVELVSDSPAAASGVLEVVRVVGPQMRPQRLEVAK